MLAIRCNLESQSLSQSRWRQETFCKQIFNQNNHIQRFFHRIVYTTVNNSSIELHHFIQHEAVNFFKSWTSSRLTFKREGERFNCLPLLLSLSQGKRSFSFKIQLQLYIFLFFFFFYLMRYMYIINMQREQKGELVFYTLTQICD